MKGTKIKITEDTKIKFTGDTADDLSYQPDKFRGSFYQICRFKNENSNLYIVRKVIFNEKFEILKIFEKKYDIHTIKKFFKKTNANKYKIYPLYDVSNLECPSSADLMNSCSDLSNNTAAPRWNNTECHDLYNDIAYGGMQNCNNMASPGKNISNQTRKVGGADPSFYTGAPELKNLMMINNNLI